MSVQDRIKRYREKGGGADLVRVEVLVPASARAEILAQASLLRAEHRRKCAQLQSRIDEAVHHYGVKILDNIDLSRLSTVSEQAQVLGKALMARGDAKAFILGRQLVSAAEL